MKIQFKNKKKVALIILAAIVFIVLFLLYLLVPSLKFEAAKSQLRHYFSNDFNISTIEPTEESESFSYYERSFIGRSIKYLAGGENKLSLVEYLDAVKSIKASFKSECTEGNFENCDPYKILMPYCVVINHPTLWVDEESSEIFKKEVNEDVAYNDAMRYWKTYIEEEELKEDDLSTFVGIVIAEKLCGDLNQYDTESLLKKLLKIEIDRSQAIEKRIHSLKKKVSVIRELQSSNYPNQFSQRENLNSPICHELPSVDEIEKINDVCAIHDYYRVKAFCTKEDVINSVRDYLLTTKYLEERYSNLDEVVCQLSLYSLIEK